MHTHQQHTAILSFTLIPEIRQEVNEWSFQTVSQATDAIYNYLDRLAQSIHC